MVRPGVVAVHARARGWAVLISTVLMFTGLVVLAGSADAEVGPGCESDRPAVVHRQDGVLATAERTRVPCGTETGHYTGETTIGVHADGTVWFSAADWEWALVKSSDMGGTWERFAVPGPQAYPGCPGISSGLTPECDDSQTAKNNTVADAFLWIDPVTSRIYWTKTYGYALCASLNYSDDGVDWVPVSQFGCPGGDYEKIAGGPAPAGTDQPVGHPHVLYGCTNGPAPTFVVGPSRVCYKSLDGGDTWESTGVPVTPNPQAPGCIHFQESHRVAPDGTLYLPLGCALDANRVMVAWSDDQATTWNYVEVPISGRANAATLIGGVSLDVDEDGRLYVIWTSTDNHVQMVSTDDRGGTWSGPFDVTMPGITTSTPRAQIAAREPGHVAIAYYGYPGEDGATRYGYLTESFDANTDDPTFHSAQLSADDDPLYFPTSGGSLPRNDYLGVTIGPDGTPWTALVKLLSADPDEEGFVQSTGFAGRLAWADGASSVTAEPEGPEITTTDPAAAPAPPAPAVAPTDLTLPATGGGAAAIAGAAIFLASRFRRPRS